MNGNIRTELERYFPEIEYGRPVVVGGMDREMVDHNLNNVFFWLAHIYRAKKADIADVESALTWLNANLTGAKFERIEDEDWWELRFD